MIGDDFTKVTKTVSGGKLSILVKAIILSFGFTFVMLSVFSALIAYTKMSEGIIPTVSLSVMVVGVCIFSCILTEGAKSRGYLKGILSGVFYVFVIYLISAVISRGLYFNAYIFVLLAVGFFAGAFGGILGINLSFKNKR